MTSNFDHDDSQDDEALGTGRTGETGLVVTESPGPGVDSIICSLRAPHEPASVGKVRREVVNDLQTRDLPEQLVDEAEMVASELLTNAVRHGGGTGWLGLWAPGGSVVCEVTDRGTGLRGPSSPGRPAVDQTGGWGLWLAEELTDSFDVETGEGGTTVRISVRTS